MTHAYSCSYTYGLASRYNTLYHYGLQKHTMYRGTAKDTQDSLKALKSCHAKPSYRPI